MVSEKVLAFRASLTDIITDVQEQDDPSTQDVADALYAAVLYADQLRKGATLKATTFDSLDAQIVSEADQRRAGWESLSAFVEWAEGLDASRYNSQRHGVAVSPKNIRVSVIEGPVAAMKAGMKILRAEFEARVV